MTFYRRRQGSRQSPWTQYIEQSIKAIGANVSIVRFTRFGLGEGIEKKVDDFAEEVRKQAGL